MHGRLMMLVKKGSKPEKKDPIDEAISRVGDGLDRYDLDSMAAKHSEPDEDEEGGPSDMDADNADSPENCEACKNGTCDNPEHLSEDDLKALEMLHKE